MLDTKKTGKVEAVQAAAFLKKSQLREPVLHKVAHLVVQLLETLFGE